MYYVDEERIETQLSQLQTCLRVLEQIHSRGTDDLVTHFAAARAFHVAIECVTDIGNALIDGFMMRDPGSYEDIVEVMKEESVLPSEEADAIKKLVRKRKMLVVRYTEVGEEALDEMVKHADALRHFPKRIRDYLAQET